MTNIVNACLSSGAVPSRWKNAILVRTRIKDNTNSINGQMHAPISLTCTLHGQDVLDVRDAMDNAGYEPFP